MKKRQTIFKSSRDTSIFFQLIMGGIATAGSQHWTALQQRGTYSAVRRAPRFRLSLRHDADFFIHFNNVGPFVMIGKNS